MPMADGKEKLAFFGVELGRRFAQFDALDRLALNVARGCTLDCSVRTVQLRAPQGAPLTRYCYSA